MRTWDKALLRDAYARTAHAAVSLEQFADDQHRQADAREREQARRQLRESLQQRAHEHRAATELAAAKEQLQRDEIRALRQDHDRALLAARDREERQAQEARLWRTGRAVEAQRQARTHPHRGASVEAGRQLEERVAQLLERDGFTSVEVTGAPGDLGADVTARTVRARRVVVQCKNYADRRVTSTELQRFGGTFRTVHSADIGLVVTTTDFTRAAIEYARQARRPAHGRARSPPVERGHVPHPRLTGRRRSQVSQSSPRATCHRTGRRYGPMRTAAYRSTVSSSSASIS
ncbi:restriction endonuclease [Streptomyces canus]